MSLPKVVFLDRATIPVQIQVPRPSFAHDWVEYDLTSSEQVVERLSDADIVISNKVMLDQTVLSQLPNLKMIAVAATGFNNVDVNYCAEHNVAVANVRGYATRSVPEHVIAMLLPCAATCLVIIKTLPQASGNAINSFVSLRIQLGTLQVALWGWLAAAH